jgi:nicotinamide-nucleotide amidase
LNTFSDNSDASLQQLSEHLGECLKAQQLSVCTAESCTGGWIAKCLTDIAGSSAWFDCGIVTYSNQAKQRLLQVRSETLLEFGAVSKQTALEMVSGALATSSANLAVAVTGIAGPGGEMPNKPVGTVCIAWHRRGQDPKSEVFYFEGNREAVRRQTVEMALRGLMTLL